MQEMLLLPQWAESKQQERRATFEQGMAMVRKTVDTFVDWLRGVWKSIMDAVRPALQTLIAVLSRYGLIVPPKRTSYSPQTRHYLAVKRRGIARRRS